MPQYIKQIHQFNNDHRIGANQKISAGYKDGGRRMKFDARGVSINKGNREIITVKDPSEDVQLLIAIGKAKNATRHAQSIEDKAHDLSLLVHNLMPDNPDDNGYVKANTGKEVSLGDLIANGVGVCRHRSLLFKVLADAIGIPTALVRGHYEGPQESGPHAWNEVVGSDGQKMIIDVMHQRSFDMSQQAVTRYNHLDGTKMYDRRKNDHGRPTEKRGLGSSASRVHHDRKGQGRATCGFNRVAPHVEAHKPNQSLEGLNRNQIRALKRQQGVN